jgi:hypothetical protein
VIEAGHPHPESQYTRTDGPEYLSPEIASPATVAYGLHILACGSSNMNETHQFVRVEFFHFKAFKAFVVNLRHFNILVGPNNAGKSTILAAFRILAAAMRRANTRKPEMVSGPDGKTVGYEIDLKTSSVAE